MRGERFREVIEVPAEPHDWPSYYVITDQGIYEYTGQVFTARTKAPEGLSVPGLTEGFDKVINEVRGDGETAVLLLDSMDMIVFGLKHDPFGSEFRSWPTVTFSPAASSNAWEG
jgi:hypothetical protein